MQKKRRYFNLFAYLIMLLALSACAALDGRNSATPSPSGNGTVRIRTVELYSMEKYDERFLDLFQVTRKDFNQEMAVTIDIPSDWAFQQRNWIEAGETLPEQIDIRCGFPGANLENEEEIRFSLIRCKEAITIDEKQAVDDFQTEQGFTGIIYQEKDGQLLYVMDDIPKTTQYPYTALRFNSTAIKAEESLPYFVIALNSLQFVRRDAGTVAYER